MSAVVRAVVSVSGILPTQTTEDIEVPRANDCE
ncbi:Uncharacterised protein [Mycobacteroides abscessus subsp. abscessus]|nr:Uncharacterised protein [Mycobacteroides abscessus subsp. abscessus]